MNKIFKVKRNRVGQSVVTSELSKSQTKGRLVASALAVAVAGMMASSGVSFAETGTYPINAGSWIYSGNSLLNNPKFQSHIGGSAVVLGKNSTVTVVDASLNEGGVSDYLTNATVINGDIGRLDGTNLGFLKPLYASIPEAVLNKSKSINEQFSNKDLSFVSIGGSNISSWRGGIAIGDNSESDGGIAIGSSSYAHYLTSVAIGRGAVGSHHGIAIGEKAVAGVNYEADSSPVNRSTSAGVAIGWNASTASGIALGKGASSDKGYNAIAIGATKAHGTNSVAIGVGYPRSSGAIGADSITIKGYADADNSMSLGYISRAVSSGAVSLGYNAQTITENGVALGSNSFADVSSGKVGYLSNGEDSPTWVSTLGSVSVGYRGYEKNGISINKPETRQITSLAAGTQDTDAVNVAQLKASTNEIVNILGGNATVDPSGNVTMTNIGGTGKDNINDAIAAAMAKFGGNSTIVAQGDGIAVTKATTDLTDTYTVALSSDTTESINKAHSDIANLQTTKANKTDLDALDSMAVKYDSPTKDSVTFKGSTGTTLNNVAAGVVSADSKQTINGSQLHNVVTATANHLGGGSTVLADGTLTAPTYSITDYAQGTTVQHNNVGDALGHLNKNQNALAKDVQALTGAMGNLRSDINRVRREAHAGTAAAMAIANLGQPYKPAQTAFGLSSAIYKGRVGVAAGVSRITENGKFLFKGAVNTNNDGQFGAAVSATYYFD